MLSIQSASPTTSSAELRYLHDGSHIGTSIGHCYCTREQNQNLTVFTDHFAAVSTYVVAQMAAVRLGDGS